MDGMFWIGGGRTGCGKRMGEGLTWNFELWSFLWDGKHEWTNEWNSKSGLDEIQQKVSQCSKNARAGEDESIHILKDDNM